jgi:SAM-dependent methyltransferase/uncharacterized protein YbaR (Trm112 family)
MKLQTLNELCCPYCAASLEIAEGIEIKEDDINQALVRCDCSIYPLIEGILVLKNNIAHSNYLALTCLKNRRLEQALYYLMKPRIAADRFIQAAARRKLMFSRIPDNIRTRGIHDYVHKITGKRFFADAVEYLKIGGYGDYFLHRFSSVSFLASLPLVLMLKSFPGPILEIGSGMGHHAFIISSFFPQKEIICTDSSFINLFLAKRFLAPRAEFICLDANDPLPFRERKFNIIFSSDALHYLYSKKLILQEIGRISQEEAIVLLMHLHNLGGQNPVAGSPLTAEGWLRLCLFPHAKLLPELRVFEDFLQKDSCNLLDACPPVQLKQANAFMLIASNSAGVFKNYSNIGEQYFYPDKGVVLNPLYRRQRKTDAVRLSKKWPTDFIRLENLPVDKIMPDSCSLDEEIVRSVQDNQIAQIDIPKISELMRKLIFIRAPKNYRPSR